MDWLLDPLDYPFMQRALLEVAIVGTVCGLVGSFVVLRGLAFIGDALAHAVFPGVVLAYMAGRSILIGASIFGLLTAMGVGLLSRNRRVSEDSAIGVMFASFFDPLARWVMAVKNESPDVPYSDAAQKFPRPVWPGLMSGPVYVHVRFRTAALSSGLSRSGLGPIACAENDHPAGWPFDPSIRPAKS